MGRLTLKQMILNKCEEERGLAERLAVMSGYNSGSSLMKILKDEKKEFAKFNGLIKIVRYLFPSDELTLMAEYAASLDPNKQTARNMVEYLEIARLNGAKKDLIERLQNSSNTLSKEYGKLYKLDDEYLDQKQSFIQTVSSYGNITSKTPEIKVGVEIFKGYAFLDEQMHDMLGQTIYSLEFDILKIKDEYVREMYYARLMLLQIANKVSKNLITEARGICNKMLDNIEDDNYRAWAYLHLGNSYILESFDKANECYLKGMEHVNDHRTVVKVNLERSINFLDNFWNKTPRYLKPFSKHASDIHEAAFYYIRHGQKSNALKALDSVNQDELNYSQKAFHQYYRGLLTNSLKNFSMSVTYFKKAGEYYYRKLPLLELAKFGVDESILEALAV